MKRDYILLIATTIFLSFITTTFIVYDLKKYEENNIIRLEELRVDLTEKMEEKIETTLEVIKNTNEEEEEEDTELQNDDIVEDVVLAEEIVEEEPFFYLTEYERWVVECMVMGESGGEPYNGKILVAQCILNACLKSDINPSEVKKKYKYSGWNENISDDVRSAVTEVFENGYKITNEQILYFYAPKYAKGKWHETQKFIIQVGGHRFFAEWKEWS